MLKKLAHILGKVGRKQRDHHRDNRPRRVLLETTNRCNLNCPFCLVGMQNQLVEVHGTASHDLMSRPAGMMSPETFDVVRENLRSFGVEKAYLHFQGEPFLNKHITDFARRLKEDGLEVSVFTNGLAFTDSRISEFADVEIDSIRFSVDGASESTYQKNRVGGEFAKVVDNMRKVVAAHEGKKTLVEWQFLPLRNNEHEVEKARKLADEIGIRFFLKGFRETDPELAPTNPEYRSKFHPKPCTDIYLQLGIYWNGDVVPCCYDVDAKEVMGNLHEEDLETIWNREKYTVFRKRVDEAKIRPDAEPELCKNCLRWK